MLRVLSIEMLLSKAGPEELIFLPDKIDVQDAWREILLPALLQLEQGSFEDDHSVDIDVDMPSKGVTICGKKFVGALLLVIGDHVEFIELVGLNGTTNMPYI